MLRFIPALALLLFTACGLAENEQDDKNKRIYITFTDPAFEQFCLGMFDLDHDGRISRYEAQRVLVMDCSGRNIFRDVGDRRVFPPARARLQRQ